VSDKRAESLDFSPERREGLLPDIRFWMRILKEHAFFIELGLPRDRPDLIAEAQFFRNLFQDLEDRLGSRGTVQPGFFQDLRNAVSGIIEFKRKIIRLLVQCEMMPMLMPLLMDHITREAVHFLSILGAGRPVETGETQLARLLAREVFWLRQMKEHVEFVRHLLDPSERELINQTEEFRTRFSRLLETARDLTSMAEADPRTFNAAVRFTEETMAATRQLRDFKAAAHQLLLLCRILSTVPTPLLVDHIRREADKFLEELAEIRERLHEFEGPPQRGK